jgi:putative tryptophan/tyrosine transport system substrate-binding protein
MRRREFITLIGGAAVAWPVVPRAQQVERMSRVGVLMSLAENNAEEQARVAAFRSEMQRFGWTVGRNIQIDTRWGAGDAGRLKRYAAELVALAPSVILASGGVTMQALTNRDVPIVFVQVLDPIGAGYVASLARPGGNITGFTNFDYGMSEKWLELLKQIAPHVTRAAVLRDSLATSGTAVSAAIETAAPKLGLEVTAIGTDDPETVERAIEKFASRSNDAALLVVPGARATSYRDLIIKTSAKLRLPAMYPYRYFVTSGGLMAYGPDTMDQFRSAAGYVDRILKGEKPANLPVQNPTKFELTINLRTAKMLGLEIPPLLLARADEVIE